MSLTKEFEMKAYELKQGWRAAVLALSVMLAACGSDDQANNGGGIAPGGVAVGPTGVVGGVGGVSNCTTPYGQPGILTNNGFQQVCMPNVNNGACANPLYNNFGGQSVMMCPCAGMNGGGGGVVVTPPGGMGGFCGGFNPIMINNQYYYYVTPNTMNPGFFPAGGMYGYQRYYWTGSAWVWM